MFFVEVLGSINKRFEKVDSIIETLEDHVFMMELDSTNVQAQEALDNVVGQDNQLSHLEVHEVRQIGGNASVGDARFYKWSAPTRSHSMDNEMSRELRTSCNRMRITLTPWDLWRMLYMKVKITSFYLTNTVMLW